MRCGGDSGCSSTCRLSCVSALSVVWMCSLQGDALFGQHSMQRARWCQSSSCTQRPAHMCASRHSTARGTGHDTLIDHAGCWLCTVRRACRASCLAAPTTCVDDLHVEGRPSSQGSSPVWLSAGFTMGKSKEVPLQGTAQNLPIARVQRRRLGPAADETNST